MMNAMQEPMTDELFYSDGYLSEFEAEITAVNGDYVALGGTAFFPGGGGQVCDTGMIGGVRVTEVKEEKDEIFHKVPGHKFNVGDKIWCSVDWDRRYDLMKGHTAEHLLFGSLQRQDPELEIIKIFISPEAKYCVVNKDISWDKITEAVCFANKAIDDNLPVSRTMMSRDDPDIDKVRVKLDHIDDNEITVIEIGDVDIAACCGVHVMETSELGAIFVDRKVSAGKGTFEIHFEIGESAIQHAMKLAGSCMSVVNILGTKPADVEKAVSNMKDELELTKVQLKSSVSSLLKAIRPESINGVDVYCGTFPTSDRKILTDAAEDIKSKGGVAVLIGVGSNLTVMMASGKQDIDCKAILSKVLAEFGGRGGGKPDFSQGGVQDLSSADRIIESVLSKIRAL